MLNLCPYRLFFWIVLGLPIAPPAPPQSSFRLPESFTIQLGLFFVMFRLLTHRYLSSEYSSV